MINSKVGKHVKVKRKTDTPAPRKYGNWYTIDGRVRYSAPSAAAKFFFDLEFQFNHAEAQAEVDNVVADMLVHEIWGKYDPPELAQLYTLDGVTAKYRDKAARMFLGRYGRMSVFYEPHFLPGGLEDAIAMSESLFLTGKKISLPLGHFLYFCASKNAVDPSILNAWSGVPEDLQKEAVKTAVEFAREQIAKEATKQQAKAPMELHTAGGVNFYNASIGKVEIHNC